MNVLVYAHRDGSERHDGYRAWLEEVAEGDEPFGVPDAVAVGFVRVVTHPRIWPKPTPIGTALEVVQAVRSRPNHVPVAPGRRHWELFERLCREVGAKGNLAPDAYLAALAIETGSEWVTTDRDFARFPGLRWRHPLEED